MTAKQKNPTHPSQLTIDQLRLLIKLAKNEKPTIVTTFSDGALLAVLHSKGIVKKFTTKNRKKLWSVNREIVTPEFLDDATKIINSFVEIPAVQLVPGLQTPSLKLLKELIERRSLVDFDRTLANPLIKVGLAQYVEDEDQTILKPSDEVAADIDVYFETEDLIFRRTEEAVTATIKRERLGVA